MSLGSQYQAGRSPTQHRGTGPRRLVTGRLQEEKLAINQEGTMELEWEQVAGAFQPFDRGTCLGWEETFVYLYPRQPHHGLRPGDRGVHGLS